MKLIKKFLFSLFLCFFIFNPFNSKLKAKQLDIELPMVIVIPSYNNLKWYKKNITSILTQNYTNYRVIYIDDHSLDHTAEALETYLTQLKIPFQVLQFDDSQQNTHEEQTHAFAAAVQKQTSPFLLIKNVNRKGALANLYRAIQSCQPHEIIVTLDGDDWFYKNTVLQEVNRAYSSNQVWFTHGCLIEYPFGNISWCEPISKEALLTNTLRKEKCPSHLRTFYTWIFKKISLEDLLYEGEFYPMAWDMAIMFPIAEMAAERHAYLEKANYVYNMSNQINDNKVNPELQNLLDQIIRSKPPYQRLEEGDFP